MIDIREQFLNKIKANRVLYAALCFVILSFIFSGLYCKNVAIAVPENFFAHFFLRAFLYFILITDAFILSLYRFCIPLSFLTQLAGCCLWGMMLRYSYFGAALLSKILLFLPILLCAVLYSILNAMVCEILLLNFRRALSFGKAALPFKQKFLYSLNEYKSCMYLFFAMLVEIAISCVISAML